MYLETIIQEYAYWISSADYFVITAGLTSRMLVGFNVELLLSQGVDSSTAQFA